MVGEFEMPDSSREDRIDIVIIDLDRVALEHRPALVSNLMPFIPSWCFSDVTSARKLIPGLTKEAMDTKPSLVISKTRNKPIRIGSVHHVVFDKVESPESLVPRKENREATEKEKTQIVHRKIVEASQARENVGNAVWRT